MFLINVLVSLVACVDSAVVSNDVETGDTNSLNRIRKGSIDCWTSPATPSSGIVVGGTISNVVARYTCEAIGEDVEIHTMELDNILTATGELERAILTGSYGEDAVATLVTITYQDENGFTITNNSFLSESRAVFENMNAYFPVGFLRDITVRIDTNLVGSMGVESGSAIQLNWNGFKGSQFEAVGQRSGRPVWFRDYLIAEPFTIHKTVPMITLSSGSPSGLKVPGILEVLRFNVSAAQMGDVTIESIPFYVWTTDNVQSGWNMCGADAQYAFGNMAFWSLIDVSDPSTPIEGEWIIPSEVEASCAALEPMSYIAFLADDLVIPAGATTTFSVEMDSTGASTVADDALAIDIPEDLDGTLSVPFAWSDGEIAGIDGRLIKSLPVIGGTLVF